MAKFRAKIDTVATKKLLEKLDDLKSPMNRKETDAMGKAVIKEMKALIANGNSPIAGYGKFPAYKNPASYPGNRKPRRPVNLKLTGAFLKDLSAKSFQQSGRWALSVGFNSPKQRIKERGHREGANGQPKRPIIPDPGQRERFANKIQNQIFEAAKKAVRRVVRARK